jgi:hypothetical protein
MHASPPATSMMRDDEIASASGRCPLIHRTVTVSAASFKGQARSLRREPLAAERLAPRAPSARIGARRRHAAKAATSTSVGHQPMVRMRRWLGIIAVATALLPGGVIGATTLVAVVHPEELPGLECTCDHGGDMSHAPAEQERP